MRRAVKLTWVNFRYCFIRTLEFRSEVISWSIQSIIWALLALAITDLIFGQVDSIAGWTRNEAMALSLTGSMFISFLWWNVFPSMLRLVETIRTGDFDFYLLRPVNSRFLISISRFGFDNYPRVLVTVILLIGLIVKQSMPVSFLSIISFIGLFLLGSVIFYCLFLIIATLSFWLTQMEELAHLFDTILTMGRYPTDIFQSWLKIIFFYLIPMVFVATFPVRALFGRGGIELVLQGFALAVIFFVASQWFWNFALRRYSSASS